MEKKTCILIMPALFSGGAEKQYRYIMNEVSDSDNRVIVLLLNSPAESEKEITELYPGFARSLQSIIANKNMNDLAELLVYPSYIGIDDGIVVNNRTEFMALDADKVFTDALIEAVKTADVSSNELTKAGFIVGDPSGKPAVTFGLDKEGSIGITAINY